MAGIGFVMDNLARAGNARDLRQLEERKVGLQEGALGIQKQKQAFEKNNQLTASFQSNVDKQFALIDQLITSADASGIPRDNPQLVNTINTMKEETIRTAQLMKASSLPVDPNLLSSQFDAKLQSPTPDQLVEQEASRAGTIKSAELEASQPFQNRETVNLHSKSLNKSFIGREEPDGSFTMIRDGQRVVVPEDSIKVSSTITGTKEDVLGRKEKELAREGIESAEFNINSLSGVLDDLVKSPGASGARSAIANTMGGAVGQIPIIGPNAEEALVKFVTGTNPEEVARIRTRAQVNVAQMLSFITGEESGRFTEAEREIATKTLRGIDKNSSVAQIAGATKTVMEILIDNAQRDRLKLKKEPIYDISTPAGINDFGEYLLGIGFNEDDALRIIQERVRRSARNNG